MSELSMQDWIKFIVRESCRETAVLYQAKDYRYLELSSKLGKKFCSNSSIGRAPHS